MAAGYGVVVLAVLVGIMVARRWLAAGSASAAAGELDGQPHAVAYLSGGPQRALMAALGSMWAAGTVVAQGRQVRAEGSLDATASDLERAIHLSAATPIRWDYLDADPTVSRELVLLRYRLEQAGVLLSDEQRRRIKHTGWWMAAVAVLGLPVTAVVGAATGAMGGMLILALFVAGILLGHAPRLSRRGTAKVQALSTRYAALAPQMRPDCRAYGPAYAGLAVGLFGHSTLRDADPDFAQLLAEGYPRYWSWGSPN